LHLAGFGSFVSEAVDKPLGSGDFSSLVRRSGPLSRKSVFPSHNELGKSPDILIDLSTGQLKDPIGDRVDEITIVADK
jgi:hypothetical protein